MANDDNFMGGQLVLPPEETDMASYRAKLEAELDAIFLTLGAEKGRSEGVRIIHSDPAAHMSCAARYDLGNAFRLLSAPPGVSQSQTETLAERAERLRRLAKPGRRRTY